jgi:hypothetical protein
VLEGFGRQKARFAQFEELVGPTAGSRAYMRWGTDTYHTTPHHTTPHHRCHLTPWHHSVVATNSYELLVRERPNFNSLFVELLAEASVRVSERAEEIVIIVTHCRIRSAHCREPDRQHNGKGSTRHPTRTNLRCNGCGDVMEDVDCAFWDVSGISGGKKTCTRFLC